MRVYEERGVKIEDDTSNEQINLVYFLFWTSTYELLSVALFFWVDLLPWYGDTKINNFGTKYVYFNSKKLHTITCTLRAGGLVGWLFCERRSRKLRTLLASSPEQARPPARRLQNTWPDAQGLVSEENGLSAALVGVYENEFGFIKRATGVTTSNRSTYKGKNLQFSLLFADGGQGFNVSSVGQAVVLPQVSRESFILSHMLCRTSVLQISWGTQKEQHCWLL